MKAYLAGYLSRYDIEEIDEKLVEEFGESLLKLFTVLELVDIGYSSSKFKTFLFGLNIKLVNKDVSIYEIKNNITRHIDKEWDKDDIEKEILGYNKNILVFLNEYLYSKKMNTEFVLPEKYEIEHIMPRSGQNISQIRIDAGLRNNDEFLDTVNKLGNKILLEENINRSIGNAWFRTKTQNSVKDKKGYKDSKFALASSIVKTYSNIEKPVWTKEDIKRMTEKISKRIAEFVFDSE